MSNRIAVDVIEDIVSDQEILTINPSKSAPKWFLDRAIKYIEKEGLNDEDDLWFVDKGGYHPLKFIPNFIDAINNAKSADTDKNHFLPNRKATKVYQLGEAMINVIGRKGFDNFLSQTLPQLLSQESERAKKSKRRK